MRRLFRRQTLHRILHDQGHAGMHVQDRKMDNPDHLLQSKLELVRRFRLSA